MDVRRIILSMGDSSEPKISVVIPCFNAELTITDQLLALEEQEGAPDFEIVAVDNGSTDGTWAVLEDFMDSSKLNIRIFRAVEHQGASYARNIGIGKSRAERIMFCDADDVVSRWWLSHGYRCFDYYPVWNGAAILLNDKQFHGSIEQIRSEFGDSPAFEAPETRSHGSFPVLMGGNFGATKEALTSVGGFDLSFLGAGEDNDLGFRFRQSGFDYPNAQSVRIGYRGKWDPYFVRRLAFRQAKAHALIATRYDAWDKSSMPRIHQEMVRIPGSAILMVFRIRQGSWLGFTNRLAALCGLVVGKVKYQTLGRLPASQIGIGIFGNHS